MSSGYRLAPALAARLVGGVLVAVAVLVLLTTVLAAAFGWSLLVVLVVAFAGVAATVSVGVAVRRIPVLSVDPEGYRVRWVRGAGVKAARWREVKDAVTAAPAGVDCLVLRLHDGRVTSVPVIAIGADRDRVVEVVRDHLTRGEGLRPL